jgi:hypothetical protein
MLTVEDRLFNHDSTWSILNFGKRYEDASHSKALRAKCSRRLFHFAKLGRAHPPSRRFDW